MKSKTQSILSAVFLAAGLVAGQAHAGLLGSTATFEYRFPNPGDVYGGEGMAPQTAVVGAGVEFNTGYYQIDVQDNKIVYNLANTGWNNTVAHNGPRVTFTGLTIDTAALDALNTALGGNGLVFTWGTDYIDLNWANYSGNHIEVTVGATQSSDVPEPASLALLGAGLAAVAAVRRRKTQR
jgi:hypothetical protein